LRTQSWIILRFSKFFSGSVFLIIKLSNVNCNEILRVIWFFFLLRLGVAEKDGHVGVFPYNDEIYRERSHETQHFRFSYWSYEYVRKNNKTLFYVVGVKITFCVFYQLPFLYTVRGHDLEFSLIALFFNGVWKRWRHIQRQDIFTSFANVIDGILCQIKVKKRGFTSSFLLIIY
jgi:hypothetical protein